MSFQMNNNGFNNFNQNNQQQQQDKPRTNFKLGRIYGTNAILEVGTWNAPSGTRAVLTIKQSIGTDPSTNMPIYENKPPKELPHYYMNADNICLLLEACKHVKSPTELGMVKLGSDQKGLKIDTSNNQINITITNDKGPRTITLESHSIGNQQIYSGWIIFVKYLETAFFKALYGKLDENEFGTALAAVNNNDSSSEEDPF